MDKTTTLIAEYALSQSATTLTPEAIRAGIRHHLDGVGCAAGGFNGDPCRIAREIAAMAPAPNGCTTYGLAERSAPEYAVFANASANRHLDYNDSGIAPSRGSGGHPNDLTPAVLAAVELMGGSGRDLILGCHVGYEVFAAVSAFNWRKRGWDQGVKVAISAAAAAARLFGLDKAGIGNAISLALTPGVPFRVTRTGELSHWKGCATAHAAMNGLFAARLAQKGMTGPSDPFEGVDGLWAQITGPFELDGLGELKLGMGALERTFFKFFPSEYNSQGPIASVIKLRNSFEPQDVLSIDVRTYWMAWHEIGGGQGDAAQKWDPKTRESADHSLPYMIAVALVDGMVSLDSFTPARVQDPELRPLMNKISVTHDPAYDDRLKHHGEWCARIEIRLKDGRTLTEETKHPRGSIENPMDDNDLNMKFDSMIGYVLPPGKASECRERLWSLDGHEVLDPLTALLRQWSWRGSDPISAA